MFDFVDDVAARAECFVAMACACAYPHCHFSDGEVANAVHAGCAFDAEALDRFRDDAFAFFYRERLECLVFEVSDAHSLVVVANESFEGRVAAARGVGELGA